MTILSACGLICDECEFFIKNECGGCHKVEGKPFWAEEYHLDTCPLYECSVEEKKLKNCGKCNELPCKLFVEMKDPSSTQEQHEQSIKDRVERLKKDDAS